MKLQILSTSLLGSLLQAEKYTDYCPGIENIDRSSGPFTAPELPYAYDALEPFISQEIMELHHGKHHKGYVRKLNKLIDDTWDDAKLFYSDATQERLNFLRGGHVNHCIFWKTMSPYGGGEIPDSELKEQIIHDFGSVENLKNQLNAASKTVMGSGWGWLGWNEELQKLQIATTANQDRLEKIHGLKPLIGIDVWEHAYYLQYKNLRGEYLQQFWNVIDWLNVVDRFDEILFAKYSE